MTPSLNKGLCAVYTLVHHDTNPESLIELRSQRETTYALRGKDILTMSKVNIIGLDLNPGVIRRPNFRTAYLMLLERYLLLKLLEKVLANESILR